jgi:hypothetical protein
MSKTCPHDFTKSHSERFLGEMGKSGDFSGLSTRAPVSFLYIGTGRSASTWFFEVLREHPRVFVPLNKGTFYFSHFYASGREWYDGFFRTSHNASMVGEVCEDYLSNRDALQRIKEYRSDIRLVCCLRNPYERAISAWRFLNRNGIGTESLADQGAIRPDIFFMGNYGSQIEFLLSLFEREQVLLIVFDDVVRAPREVVRNLYEFLGVDSRFQPKCVDRVSNANGKPRIRPVARFVNKVHMLSWGRSRFFSNFVGRIKRIGWIRSMVRKILYDERGVTETWINRLVDFPDEVIVQYEEEITKLEGLLGRSLAHWRAPAAVVQAAKGNCLAAMALT